MNHDLIFVKHRTPHRIALIRLALFERSVESLNNRLLLVSFFISGTLIPLHKLRYSEPYKCTIVVFNDWSYNSITLHKKPIRYENILINRCCSSFINFLKAEIIWIEFNRSRTP